jgi:hypothetical protein
MKGVMILSERIRVGLGVFVPPRASAGNTSGAMGSGTVAIITVGFLKGTNHTVRKRGYHS